MKRLMIGVIKVDNLLYILSGIILSLMIILTAFDVVLRNLGYPIRGSMEIIQFGGSLVFAFSIPYGTWLGAQVAVDLVIGKLDPGKQRILNAVTRCIGMLLFLFIAYNFFMFGLDMERTGDFTSTFKVPYYPFIFAISFSFFFQALTIACDLINTVKGADSE